MRIYLDRQEDNISRIGLVPWNAWTFVSLPRYWTNSPRELFHTNGRNPAMRPYFATSLYHIFPRNGSHLPAYQEYLAWDYPLAHQALGRVHQALDQVQDRPCSEASEHHQDLWHNMDRKSNGVLASARILDKIASIFARRMDKPESPAQYVHDNCYMSGAQSFRPGVTPLLAGAHRFRPGSDEDARSCR